jgi:predicted MFS family arabinose efflux permease
VSSGPTIAAGTHAAGHAGTQAALGKFRLLLIGLTCAICVANNYYSQPLLVEIARDLGIPRSLAGLAPTLTQLGIAAGMMFLLPLGDRIDNRRITTTLLALQSVALAIMAVTDVPPLYMAACLVAGLCGIVTYLLPAYATRLVEPERRGRVTGLLATGILTGIMLGRSVAGIAGYEIGWRAVYGVAAAATLAAAATMALTMPDTPGLRHRTYGSLLRSVFGLVRQSALLRQATMLQALSFGSFNALWVGLTLHLQRPPFDLDTRRIGELALVAVTSAIAAPFVGRMADRLSTASAVRFAFLVTAAGWVALMMLPASYVGIVSGMVLVGIGAIGTDVTLRTALYRLPADVRMRLNAFYSTGTFVGGSAFSFATPLLWAHLGWGAVAGIGLAATLVGLLIVREREA